MDKYQPYQVYVKTNHGVAKELPKGWVLSKFKYEVDYVEGPGILATDFHEVGVPLLRIQNVKDRYTSGDIKTYLDPQKVRDKWEHFKTKSGDLLISGSASTDLVTEVTEQYEGAVPYTGLIRMRAKKNRTDKNYLRYFLQSELFKNQIDNLKTGSTIQHFGPIHLQQIVYPSALVTEQAQIANFLDHETAKIDTLIAKQEKLIELLKEKRQAVISHAVTKGLNQDAPMKDSGVEWLGEVPEHWVIKSYRYACKIYRGKFGHRPRNDPAFYDGEYPFIQTGDVARAGKYIKDYKQTLNEKGIGVSQKFPVGTLMMAIAANIGDTAILGFEAYAPDSVVGFKPKADIDLEFLRYSFMAAFPALEQTSTQSTQANLNVDRIGAVQASFPSISEQREIVAYLDTLLEQYDDIESKSQKSIELMKERKTALISAAVTGKIDVRDWEPK